LFSYTLSGDASKWMIDCPKGNFDSWFNIKASFIEKFGPPNAITCNRSLILAFKQLDDETLTEAWERFRELIYGTEHGLRDWMILHTFYSSLRMRSMALLDNECGKSFMNLKAYEAHIVLDGLLLDTKVGDSIRKAGLIENTSKKEK
jgi:hypothetical protein